MNEQLKQATRLWIDTEFNEHEGRHALISMALVAEDGREWYEVLPCLAPRPWVMQNVMPKLRKEPVSMTALAYSLADFLAPYDSIHIIGDWPTDIALFCDALIVGPGLRIDTPALTLEVIRLDGKSADPHNALADARGIRDAHLTALASEHAGDDMAAQLSAVLDEIPVHSAVNNGVPRTERENGWNEAMDWIVERVEPILSRAAVAKEAPKPRFACVCKFDAWKENPYTKVLEKSIDDNYVPKGAAPEPVARDAARLLKWSEPARPDKTCPYDHSEATTPFGQLRITWKGWKAHGAFMLDETPWPDGFIIGNSLEEVQAAAEMAYRELLRLASQGERR